MTYQVLVTDAALHHIEEASSWWADHRSLRQALRWLDRIHERIEILAENPERCAIAHESPRFSFELRELLFGVGRRPTHRILFRIIGDTVEVLAVRQTSRADFDPVDLA